MKSICWNKWVSTKFTVNIQLRRRALCATAEPKHRTCALSGPALLSPVSLRSAVTLVVLLVRGYFGEVALPLGALYRSPWWVP